MKRIAICFDGTWNRPEKNFQEDFPTNVIKFARSILPKDKNGVEQIVFYDWGIGSYHEKITGGGMGHGLEKNILDGYRFIVHNYSGDDELYFFGFSRGAYTARSLCGLINNCGILKKENAHLIESAFQLYKTKKYKPRDDYSVAWRKKYSVSDSAKIKFVGVWDTVGSMGLPFTFFGLIKDKDLFYDRKIGSNIKFARHALSLDEQRDDFEPTIWQQHLEVDLLQVWFAGVHSDVGGGYKEDKDGTCLSDIPMMWMRDEAQEKGLEFFLSITTAEYNPLASQHNEYKGKYKLLGKRIRKIPEQKAVKTWVHESVKNRYESGYKSKPIENYLKEHGRWPPIIG